MIRVLVVDDSATVRSALTKELSKYDDIEVVASAPDAFSARDEIARLRPDVMTLDVEMPRMSGLAFLEKLMRHHPLPVVVVSAFTPRNSENALRAFALGAVEVVSKPNELSYAHDFEVELVQAIRAAAFARVVAPAPVAPAPSPSAASSVGDAADKIIAIGASTGGVQAIEEVLRRLPRNGPGTVFVQHMPPGFTQAFAKRLNQFCQMEVREARDCDAVIPGVALIAPAGATHMTLEKRGDAYVVRLREGPLVSGHRPSVDVLFQSVARVAGSRAVGVLLTGMGADGARGLLAMRESGAFTVAQNEASCVVFGMPKEAIQLGAACKVVALPNIARAALEGEEYAAT
jgi:two-component system, chemotaxis family, protein-glutamate methylesterase/glutaminase